MFKRIETYAIKYALRNPKLWKHVEDYCVPGRLMREHQLPDEFIEQNWGWLTSHHGLRQEPNPKLRY